MPRVNRDLERRLAARRQRQSRRVVGGAPARLRFGEPTTPAATDEARPQNRWTEEAANPAPERLQSRTARPAARPFSDYRKDYAYVISDLRRIAMVVGGLMAFVVGLAAILRV